VPEAQDPADGDPAAGDSAAEVPVVAVASGKGGVGKTTAAVNLALALTAGGVRTGLVDADLYGPDAAHMMGLRRQREAAHLTVFVPRGAAAERLQAVERHGIQLASAAFLMGESQGLGIGAPIAELLVHRLISGTQWPDLDCLVVDLPPGTADVQQLVFRLRRRRTFVLLVVTPQVVAHRNAHRLLDSLGRGQVDILGGIENMAGQVCRAAARPPRCSRPRHRTRPSGPRCPSWPACRSAPGPRRTPTAASRSWSPARCRSRSRPTSRWPARSATRWRPAASARS